MIKGKFISGILLAALALSMLQGCDSFRRLAGRPTSDEIAAKRELIQREEAAHQARMDSLSRIEKAKADSIALLDKIKDSGEMLLSASSLRRVNTQKLDKRYYIIVGAFSNADNANWLASKITAAGYEVEKIPYGNGFTAVGAAGTDSLAHLWDNLQKVRSEQFCPKDVWILVNE